MINRFVFVIGAMKAGTTSLVDHLAAHPGVAVAAVKEPAFFAYDEVFAKGLAWYESLFNFDPEKHVFALEGSTDYAKHPHTMAPERIREFSQTRDVRLIFIMRHPLRRIESHARHVQGTRRELGARNSPRPDHSLDSGVSAVSLDISRYAQQIDQYKDFYEDGRLFLLTLERLSSGSNVMEEICGFLDLDPALLPKTIKQANQKREFVYGAELPDIYSVAASIAPLRAFALRLIPSGLRRRMRLELRGRRRIRGRFALTPNEESALLNDLRPDLKRLRDDYGIDAEREWAIPID